MKIRGTYILVKNFEDKNDIVLNTMNKIYKNSLEYYLNSYNSNEMILMDLSVQLKFIIEKIMEIENYLYYYKDTPKFELILYALKKVSTIALISDSDLNLSKMDNEIIYIKQGIGANNNLSEDERSTLYLIREIELLINDNWLNDVRANVDLDNKREIYDGFDIISQTLAQERAEQYIYGSLSKERPIKEFMTDYNFCKTNLDSYGQYETPVMWFGASLNGIGCLRNPEEVIDKFSIKALDSSFARDIIDEYNSNNNINDLWLILQHMGKLKDSNKFKSSLEIVSELLVPLRDYNKQKQKVNN